MELMKFSQARRKSEEYRTRKFKNSDVIQLSDARARHASPPLISGQECLHCTDYGDTIYYADFRKKRLKKMEYHGCMESMARKFLKEALSNQDGNVCVENEAIVRHKLGNLRLAVGLKVGVYGFANSSTQAYEVEISSDNFTQNLRYLVFWRNGSYRLSMILNNKCHNLTQPYSSLDDLCFAMASCTALQDLVSF